MREKEFGDQTECVPGRAFPATGEGSSPHANPAPRCRRIILIVDDHRDCADSLQVLLSSFGHEVHVAYDGHTAMRMFKATRFGVVLLDIAMPGMDGFELARHLRRSTSFRPALFAISGWADARTKVRAREAGIDRYLVKPVEIEELQELLEISAGEHPLRVVEKPTG
jgi:DNA-binding response OmpR family regulator